MRLGRSSAKRQCSAGTMSGSAAAWRPMYGGATSGGVTARVSSVRLKARDADDARTWGDAFLSEGSGVAVVAAELPEDKVTLFAFVSDDLIQRGLRADAVIRDVAAIADGRGGGRPHLAQAGVGDATKVGAALDAVVGTVRTLAEGLA